MAIPDFQSLMRPVLALHEDGGTHQLADVRDAIAQEVAVTPDERELLIPSGTAGLYSNRVGWALTYLAQAGLLTPQREASHRSLALRANDLKRPGAGGPRRRR